MKLKPGFLLRQMGDTTYAVAASPELASFHAVIRLNGTGVFLFRLLSEGRDVTEEALSSALAAEYGIPPERASADVSAFLSSLSKHDIFE